MEAESQQPKKLDDLPESQDKDFWGEAEVHTNLVPQPVHPRDAHYFIRKSGREAQCTHCEWGFYMEPGEKVIDGHVYEKDGKLVI